MVNKHFSEFFMIIPAADGKRYRERRDDALTAIETAIRLNLEPGQVIADVVQA